MDANKRQDALSDYAKKLIQYKAKQLKRKGCFTESDQEDLEQEMTLDLLVRLPKYDPNKATHKTFIARVIERKISNLFRHRTKEKRDYRREECSLDEEVHGDGGLPVERFETLSQDGCDIRFGLRDKTREEQNQLRIDTSLMLSEIPEDLRPIAERLKTNTITETAKGFNIPRATLYDSIKRLRLLFEDKDLKEYL